MVVMRNLYKKVRISVPYSNAKTNGKERSQELITPASHDLYESMQSITLSSNGLGYSFDRLSIFSNFPI